MSGAIYGSSGGEGGIRTLGTGVSPYNGLANRRIRPLCHLSVLRICQMQARPLRYYTTEIVDGHLNAVQRSERLCAKHNRHHDALRPMRRDASTLSPLSSKESSCCSWKESVEVLLKQ